MQDFIWIFHGGNGRFSSGAFTEKDLAEKWIAKNNLTGVLTKYPLNVGVYDWAVKNEFFTPKKEEHQSAMFIQRFSSGSQEHYHYEDGKLD